MEHNKELSHYHKRIEGIIINLRSKGHEPTLVNYDERVLPNLSSTHTFAGIKGDPGNINEEGSIAIWSKFAGQKYLTVFNLLNNIPPTTQPM